MVIATSRRCSCKSIFLLVTTFILLNYLFGRTGNKDWNARIYSYNHKLRLASISKEAQLIQYSMQKRHNYTTPKVENNISTILNANLTSRNRNISSGFVNGLFDLNGTSPSIKSKTSYVRKEFNSAVLPPCPKNPPDLLGRIVVARNILSDIFELENRFSWLTSGGHWTPDNCKPEKKVAIIVPYRCRGEQLLIWLQHIHPFLKRQLLDYTIFVVEQHEHGILFNKGMMMNAGFKEALKIKNFDCFIFHDVDLLPEDDRNLYTCPQQQPRHMSVTIDVHKYRLPYTTIFGGVTAITTENFELLNGFSNSFWGWGGEDDDMANRIHYHNLHISRYPWTIGRYIMLSHKKGVRRRNRLAMLKAGQQKFDTDGLNSLKYVVKELQEHLLYTWVLVSIDAPNR